MLQLSLEKEGVAPSPKLRLNLNKGSRFTVVVKWDCEAHHEDDVDVHALAAINDGNGAKIASLDQILSTYNTKKMSRLGVLVNNQDGSFEVFFGALRHSGDIRKQGKSETIIIDGSKMPTGINEIPLFVTVHEADHGEGHEEGEEGEEEPAFSDINYCAVSIVDENGKVLGEYRLSEEFAEFNVAQMGSLMLDEDGWHYAPVGRGFTGDFNEVLAHFS